MWPMIAGLGPLFPDGELGEFVDAAGHREKWSYKDGKSYDDSEALASPRVSEGLAAANSTAQSDVCVPGAGAFPLPCDFPKPAPHCERSAQKPHRALPNDPPRVCWRLGLLVPRYLSEAGQRTRV